ncbi:MAG: hypothetical protein ACI4O5_05640 [Oscillospiraceae bacterium]
MFLHKIVRMLERMEENQRLILERLTAPESKSGEKTEGNADEWIQNGIDNILAYQAGKRKEE